VAIAAAALAALTALGAPAVADEPPAVGEPPPTATPTPPPPDIPDAQRPPAVRLGRGIGFESDDGRFAMSLWFRGQFRYSDPFDAAPTTAAGFDAAPVRSIDVRRGRLKLGGHAFEPWVEYYLEYDFPSSRLLDLRFTIAKLDWLQLRVGQWKANYNRERVDSSGQQQFAERSIVNREFTVDRQQGVMIGGRVFPGRLADAVYYLGLFNGTGAGARNDDASMMWMARYQWHFLRRPLPFSQSDPSFSEKPLASLAFAALGNRSAYTRFSSSGGGQLDGFEPGAPGRYDLHQLLEELAFKYRGFSLQHELHWKEVEDRQTGEVKRLRGSYVQAGVLPWTLSRALPRSLELAGRFAWVDPDEAIAGDDRRELTFAANWFFRGHDNKLTLDVSRLELEQPGAPERREHRVRFQWDVSF